MVKFYLSKLGILIKRIKNPPFFIYSIFHYLNRDMPIVLSKIMNTKKKLAEEIILHTYDGSGQAVHPDCLLFDGKYWVVLTPYPFGMEEYENPSVYIGQELNDLTNLNLNPIARQYKHDFGYHLSDPCLCNDSESVYCIYRDTRRLDKSRSWNGIYIKRYLKENGIWSAPNLLIESSEDPLLSPAVIMTNDGVLHMFHVNYKDEVGKIVYTTFQKDGRVSDRREIACQGLPDKYFPWHIGIVFENLNKYGAQNNSLKGLFLLRNSKEKNDFRLYYATCARLGALWMIEDGIFLRKKILSYQKHVYKSTFIPNSGDIIYSFRDKYDRYRLMKVSNQQLR